jgi:hypothetical protein
VKELELRTTQPREELDVFGTAIISESVGIGSPGTNGAFLNRDANGIRWVTFEPRF